MYKDVECHVMNLGAVLSDTTAYANHHHSHYIKELPEIQRFQAAQW